MMPVGPLDRLPREPKPELSEQVPSERATSYPSVPAVTEFFTEWRSGISPSIPVRHAETTLVSTERRVTPCTRAPSREGIQGIYFLHRMGYFPWPRPARS